MDEDKLLKKIQLLVKEEIRAVKDIAEMTKKKVDSHDIFLHSTTENVRTIKEQQSLMNEKLDALSGDMEQVLSEVKATP